MTEPVNKKSGSAFKRDRDAKIKLQQEVLTKTTKIDTYFKKTPVADQSCTEDNNVSVEVGEENEDISVEIGEEKISAASFEEYSESEIQTGIINIILY